MNPVNPVGDKPVTNLGLWSAGILSAFLIIVMAVVNLSGGKSLPPGENQLYTPIAEASLDMSPPLQLCVTTLRTPTGSSLTEPQTFCTDFHNVHVYADEKAIAGNGTYADVNWHWARGGNSPFTFTTQWTDFITVHVQTEAERLQWQTQMDNLHHRLTAPRAVTLDSNEAGTAG